MEPIIIDDESMMQVDGEEKPFIPFTIPERISQLGDIDQNIVKLMEHTSEALAALSYIPPLTNTTTPASTQLTAQRANFTTAMDALLSTLHSVDIALKRQIVSLKEAGIIVLSDSSANGKETASLAPNGVGKIGKLEVAWLNSRSDKVESEMEAELWGEARKFVERLAEESRQQQQGQVMGMGSGN